MKYVEESENNIVDPLKFPSQILSLGESLWFTSKCEENMSKGKLLEFYNTVKVRKKIIYFISFCLRRCVG